VVLGLLQILQRIVSCDKYHGWGAGLQASTLIPSTTGKLPEFEEEQTERWISTVGRNVTLTVPR